MPIWEQPFSVKEWVEWNQEEFKKLFIVVPPLKPANSEIDRWLRQVQIQENKIQKVLSQKITQPVLDEHFPMNHDNCLKFFGYPCEMEPFCFNEGVRSHPLELYRTRVPHYDVD